MEIPDLPNISIDMDDEEINFLKSLEGKISNIDVARVEGDNLHVLGTKGKEDMGIRIFYYEITKNKTSGEVKETYFKDPLSPDMLPIQFLTALLYNLTPSVWQRWKELKNYNKKFTKYREDNLKDIKNKIKDIRVYQGTIDEVQKELGRPLKRVETNKPETFLQENNPFWLRVEAYLLGANAIVHYQPGSSIGTPVKYNNKS